MVTGVLVREEDRAEEGVDELREEDTEEERLLLEMEEEREEETEELREEEGREEERLLLGMEEEREVLNEELDPPTHRMHGKVVVDWHVALCVAQ